MNDIAHTGKSQASAMDIHSKIECQFLQRYAHYVVVDEMDQILTPSYVHMWHVLDHKRVSQEQYISYKTQQINVSTLSTFRTKIVRPMYSLLLRASPSINSQTCLTHSLIDTMSTPKMTTFAPFAQCKLFT